MLKLSIIFTLLLATQQQLSFEVPAAQFEREIVMIYRLQNKTLQEDIYININDELFKTEEGLYPKIISILEPNQKYIISLTSNQIQVHGGWVYPSDAQQALQLGSQFFSFDGQWHFYEDISELYDEYQRPQLHFSAPKNWINDPNGSIYFNGMYHIFYQYNPYGLSWSNMHWGHAISDDGVHWRHLPIALYPEHVDLQTTGGAFSGGAQFFEQELITYYTQAVGDSQLQHTKSSKDFLHFSNDQIIIGELPEKASKDFRDPVVLFNKISKRYQLFLGNSYDGIPSVIQYSSSSPKGPWVFDYPIFQAPYLDASTIECPNKFYALDKATGKQVVGLIFSINAIKADTSISLYVIGKEDNEGRFYNTTDIQRVDHGGHFYATQLFAGQTDKTYAITWMQDWNKNPIYLGNDHFSSIFTFIREMFFVNGQLHQLPIESVKKLRKNQIFNQQIGVQLAKLNIPELSEIKCTINSNQRWLMRIMFTNAVTKMIKLEYYQDAFKLSILEQSTSREYESPEIRNKQLDTRDISIYLDRGAIEIYCNQGEIVFSERFLSNQNSSDKIILTVNSDRLSHLSLYINKMKIWELAKFYEN